MTIIYEDMVSGSLYEFNLDIYPKQIENKKYIGVYIK